MTQLWRLLFSAFTVLLVALAFSVPYVEPGSPEFYVAVFAGVLILAGMTATGALARVGWDPF